MGRLIEVLAPLPEGLADVAKLWPDPGQGDPFAAKLYGVDPTLMLVGGELLHSVQKAASSPGHMP